MHCRMRRILLSLNQYSDCNVDYCITHKIVLILFSLHTAISFAYVVQSDRLVTVYLDRNALQFKNNYTHCGYIV